MTACTFSDFYSACVSKLTEVQLRVLDPQAQYYKLKDGYCGLLVEKERTWISIFVGGMDDLWEFREVIMNAKMPLVGFKCRVGSPTYTLAKYYGASIEDSGEKYSDGAPSMRCVIDTRQTRRLTKAKEKSQALN